MNPGIGDIVKLAFYAAIVAAVFALIVTPLTIKLAVKFGALDDPTRDKRRIHTEVTPRWGGVPVFVGFLAGSLILFFANGPISPTVWFVFGGALLMTVMGMIDDKAGLSAPQQLAYMLFAGLGIQFAPVSALQITFLDLPGPGIWFLAPFATIPVTAIFVFASTKTADTIDGSDGLATGLAIISALSLAIYSVWDHNTTNVVLSCALGGACLGFLPYNFNPAKIFLAGGAQIVGFVLACIAISGPFKTAGPLAVLVPFTIFGVPMIDAMIVVIRRLLAGANIAQGDRRHIHHVLLGFGLSSRRTAYVLYLTAAALCGTFLILAKSKA